MRKEKNHSIGSGITKAACKVIVKQRLCKSGMKWKNKSVWVPYYSVRYIIERSYPQEIRKSRLGSGLPK